MRVDRVYTRQVVGTPRSASLESAAQLMRKQHVGALLVADDPPQQGDAVGIITDRDVVVQAVALGLDVRRVRVGDVMTPVIGSIPDHKDLHEALEMMRAAGVRRLAVTGRDGRVAGMLSMDDVIDGIAADLSSLAALVKSDIDHEREHLDGI